MARVQQKEREREMEAGGGGVDGPAVAAHRFGLQKTSSSLSRRRGIRWPRRHEGWMPFRLSHPTSLLNRRAREGSTAAHLSLNRRRRKKKEVFFFRVLRMKKAREKREQSFIFSFFFSERGKKTQKNDSRSSALERALRALRDPLLPDPSSGPGLRDASGGAPPQGRAAVESSQLPRGIEIVVRLGGVVPLPRRLRGPPPGVEDQRRLL